MILTVSDTEERSSDLLSENKTCMGFGGITG